jgi:RimJ/RimL family protein N-acetyltransferase
VPQDLSAVSWPARTARLSIRPATADDVDATWVFRHFPEVHRWITRAHTDHDEYAEAFLDPKRLADTLIVERDGEVIGDLMLVVESPWSQAEVTEQAKDTQAELGWVIHPDHAGHGYATEAVAELMRICFEDLGLRRVVALCFADNVASWRLMERLGMRREQHTVRDSLHRSGEWLDGYGYALLVEEWRAGR